jgi:hypothetical protein
MTSSNKEDFICEVCGSRKLEFPAYCKWNPDTQDYEFTEILFEEALCYGECIGAEVGTPIEINLNDTELTRSVNCRNDIGLSGCGNVESLTADEQRWHFNEFTFDEESQGFTCNHCGAVAPSVTEDLHVNFDGEDWNEKLERVGVDKIRGGQKI